MTRLADWWQAGGAVMPLIAVLGIVLGAVVAERLLALRDPGQDPARRLWLVRVLTAALPLVGLAGTVHGLVAAFGAMGTDPRLAGGGVSSALVATQYALALAIPGILAEALLRRRARAWRARRMVPA